MDIRRVLSSVEHADDVPRWLKAVENDVDERKFYKAASQLTKFYGNTGKLGLLCPTGDSRVGAAVAEHLDAEIKRFLNAVMKNVNRHPEIAVSVALKLVLIRGKYAKQSVSDFVLDLVKEVLPKKAMLELIHPQLLEFDDLRFLFFKSVCAVEDKHALANAAEEMCHFETKVVVDKDLGKLYCKDSGDLPFESKTAALRYRQAHQAAWLHVLKHASLKPQIIKEVLTVMHARVIPNFVKPQLLMDFIVDAYEHGGAVSLLALNAIFELIQHHQLDYPQFFTKLYELLEDGSLLFSAHRARFLRLLDLFLTSTHLPATIPASIVKRLARLCLFAPPGAIVAIIPFVYNQIKRHPTLAVMIHRPDAENSSADPFNNSERDPLHTHALDSSLWELQTLTTHYQPNVASMAKIFGQPMRKPNYNLEHFLSHSYETLFNTETKRKRDREPDLEFELHNVVQELEPTWTF